jgi:hypothetical protein
MVFSLEHDIKITKNHQNLLPTQSVLVAHTVVCNRRILRHREKFSNMAGVFILIGPHVRYFSEGNQSVSNVKKRNHGLPLCQNNVNGVYFFKLLLRFLYKIGIHFLSSTNPHIFSKLYYHIYDYDCV